MPSGKNNVDAEPASFEHAAALEREAATREILQVISRSRDDEKPVFDTILENARRLCKAPMAGLILGRAQDHYQTLAAQHESKDSTIKLYRSDQVPMDPRVSYVAQAIHECRVIHLVDMSDSELYRAGSPYVRALVDIEGIRTILFVPLIAGGEAIGAITLFRHEVAAFDDRDIALVETFAAQAVIAIENVRQFRELQSRLEREVATRRILQVISRSREDDEPVFDIILENLMRLCNTPQAALYLVSEDHTCLEIVASRGEGREELDRIRRDKPIPLSDEESSFVRTYLSKAPLHTEDMQATPRYQRYQHAMRDAVMLTNMRTLLQVPLMSKDACIGVLCVYRNEVKPYTEDEIALHQTFADQAVIAIENVRQFKALKARTEEVQVLNASLAARVEEQVGEIERMGRLKRFLPQQVADAVISAGDETMLASHRALIGILFCDIRGFTAFCEKAEPEETIEVLQTYHQEMGKLIAEHGAGVDHRSGDGIMVIFNDPLPCDDPAGNAVRLALAMRARMAELCADWRKLGYRLGFGTGTSLGYATVGMVGSEGRFEYTASGTAVNLAARLCDQAGDGEILLSPRAYHAIEDEVIAEPAGELALKGIQDPVPVVRVIRLKEGLAPNDVA